MKLTTILRKAIMERRAVLIPGCHDAFSAKIIDSCGFEALQISGFGMSGSFLGRPDVGLITTKDILEVAWNVAQAVNIPVLADMDTGGGNAVNVAWATERLIAMGVAGYFFEDQVFPKRCGHMRGKEIISAEEMVGKVHAAADVRDRMDPDFILCARTDAFGVMGLAEAIRRANLYADAGADMIFIDAIATQADIAQAAKEVKVPLYLNYMDGVTGVKTELVPQAELASMRIGCYCPAIGSILAMHKSLTAFFTALKDSPTGTLAGQTEWVSTFSEYTDVIGLPEYRAMENKYLPRQKLEEKYGDKKKIVD